MNNDITVCTVVQHCCKGDSPCQWNTPILNSEISETPEPIDIKLDRGDSAGDLTSHANVGISTLRGGGRFCICVKLSSTVSIFFTPPLLFYFLHGSARVF